MHRSRVSVRAATALLLVAAAVVLALVTGRRAARPAHSVAVPVPTRAPELAEQAAPLRPAPSLPAHRSTGWSPLGATALARLAVDPTFGQPTISGIQGNGFEQALRIDPSDPNRVYTSAPGTLSANTSWIWRSLDAGRTFKWVPNAADKTGKVTFCAGGGDTELAVDPTGSLYFNDLTLANFSTSRSDDQGRTFTCSNTGVPETAVDRQWYAVDGDPKAASATGAPDPVTGIANSIYLTNDQIGSGAPQCPVSGNGNNTLVMYRSPPPVLGALAGVQFAPSNKVTPIGSCLEGIMGNDEVSPITTRTGELVNNLPTTLANPVRHVYVIHDDATFSQIRIGRCFPVAYGAPVANMSDPSGLRCNDLLVAQLGTGPNFYDTARTGGSFPTMAIDKLGHLYAVWEQAPVDAMGNLGDTSLYYAYSTNEGTSWSTPVQVPTSGLLNNVFAWIAAGDAGKFDIAWYGTPASTTKPGICPGPPPGTPKGGPDQVNGFWSLWTIQATGADTAAPSWSAPIQASEHPIHKGSIQTVMGGQCGDRALGDFLQLRIGTQGEANVTYADSNSIIEAVPHAMFVRQNGGSGVYANTVSGDPLITTNTASDPSGDGKYEAGGTVSSNIPNLDLLSSSIGRPGAASCNPSGIACYRVTMTINNLSVTPPAPADLDPDIVWNTQWFAPASPSCTTGTACTNGGANFHVYAESTGGGAVHCFVGQNAAQVLPAGGLILTYPGDTQITGPACSFVTGAAGTITIDVPISAVSIAPATPFSATLYSVTASTMSLAGPANIPPSLGGVGGSLFNLIDVVRAYNASFGPTSVTVSSFAAKRTKGSVTVFWKTANETTVLGFNVFRTDAKGVTRKVNPSLVAAKRTGTAAGASYRLVDRSAVASKRSTYRLQLVDPVGGKSWYARRLSVR